MALNVKELIARNVKVLVARDGKVLIERVEKLQLWATSLVARDGRPGLGAPVKN